ncbi:17.7 kDa class I heat shock protein [Acorus calamus]|uniref:17.7 kDa class I heat shock protein n=1 Tax=Acorus calamus TaxID=4465 RepID=A0AAV9DLT9_ACOCL|nr:17.7 kDa class I heat shock protein [Acorus calamus]
MASLIPWVGGNRAFDPFSTDMLDPFDVGSGGGAWGLWDPTSRGRLGARGDDPTTAIARTYVDWVETDTAHVFRADIPGVRREEVKVQVEDGNVLQISGERTREEEDTGDTWHRVERRKGSFMRRFRLPENAEMEAVTCSLDHGVLTVNVPKKKPTPAQRNVRAIDISYGGEREREREREGGAD